MAYAFDLNKDGDDERCLGVSRMIAKLGTRIQDILI